MRERITFEVIAQDENAAFAKAQEEARKRYGDGSIFGSFATCTLGDCVLSFDKFKKYNYNEANRIVRELTFPKANVAAYINLGYVHHRIFRIRRTVHQYDAKYAQRYIVTDLAGKTFEPAEDHTFTLKTDADKKAFSYAVEGTEVMVRKAMVILQGSDIVSTFENVSPKEVQPSQPAFHRTMSDNHYPEYKYLFVADVIR